MERRRRRRHREGKKSDRLLRMVIVAAVVVTAAGVSLSAKSPASPGTVETLLAGWSSHYSDRGTTRRNTTTRSGARNSGSSTTTASRTKRFSSPVSSAGTSVEGVPAITPATPSSSSDSRTSGNSDTTTPGNNSASTDMPVPKGDWWHPAVGTTWQWQLSGALDLSYAVGMYDVDLFDTTAAQVAAIHARGAKAVCYMETGAWESYRPDASAYPSSVLGKSISGYSQERYVDIRQLAVLRPIIGARLDICKQKGFDGVEPDIDDSFVDVGASGIGFPVTYQDQLAFNKMVADDAHARGLAIGLKNGTFGDAAKKFVTDMEPMVDFAVNEQCAQDGVCGYLKPFTDNGKAVFHTEYLSDYSGASKSNHAFALDRFCPATTGLRFSSILKDASETLSAWRASCP